MKVKLRILKVGERLHELSEIKVINEQYCTKKTGVRFLF